MARLQRILSTLGPDISIVLRRFPLAIVLSGLFTALAIAVGREWLSIQNDEIWRAMLGLGSATIFAVAGQLFAERPNTSSMSALIARIGVPLSVLVLSFVELKEWFAPELLPFVGLFWLSVSGYVFVQNSTKNDIENQFWWMNHRAITTAIVSLVGLAVLSLGFIAIERSIDLLFGIRLETIVYSFLMSLIWFFLGPVYWMSTLPTRDEFSSDELEQPDFLSKAVGFLGQFILTPLLIAYALILLAYTVQILLNQALPVGVLGWMVLLFVITGAVNWLVLYPPFMDQRRLVRLFKKFWFWLTIIPLGLFAFGVFERASAYGLTEERYMLLAGGVWAAIATLAFLSGRFADIRLFPALAGLAFLLLSVGPWNIHNLPVQSQLWRVQSLLNEAQQEGAAELVWTSESAREIRAAFNYLDSSDLGAGLVNKELESRGFELEGQQRLVVLNVPTSTAMTREIRQVSFDHLTQPASIKGTLDYFGSFEAYVSARSFIDASDIRIVDQQLVITRAELLLATIDLSDFVLSLKEPPNATTARISFELDGSQIILLPTDVRYRDEGDKFDEFIRIEFVAFRVSHDN